MSIPPNLAYAGATFKSTGSTTPRPHGDRAAEVVNVKDFGAVGDGRDDRAAIQLAIDAAFGPAGSPHGYTNRKLNRALYFPATSGGGYNLSDSLIFTHVYGGKIYGDNTGLLVQGSGSSATAPAVITDGMVETSWENISLFSANSSIANFDLNWNGTWTDLPAAETGHGLRHNLFSNILGGNAQRGFRVAAGGYDGSFNTFMRVLIQGVGIAGIELQGANGVGNQVYGGAVGVSGAPAAKGYWASAGQFSVLMGLGQGGTTTSIVINSPYPCAIIGGRVETGGNSIVMTDGLVSVRGTNFQDGTTVIVNCTGGKITFDGCFAAPAGAGGAFITGSAPGKVYIRGCSFTAVDTSAFTAAGGVVVENI